MCRCDKCGALNPIAAFLCVNCGAQQLREPPSRSEIHTGGLVELNHLAAMSYRQALHWAGGDADRLRLVARARGYHRGWIHHVLRQRAAS